MKEVAVEALHIVQDAVGTRGGTLRLLIILAAVAAGHFYVFRPGGWAATTVVATRQIERNVTCMKPTPRKNDFGCIRGGLVAPSRGGKVVMGMSPHQWLEVLQALSLVAALVRNGAWLVAEVADAVRARRGR